MTEDDIKENVKKDEKRIGWFEGWPNSNEKRSSKLKSSEGLTDTLDTAKEVISELGDSGISWHLLSP